MEKLPSLASSYSFAKKYRDSLTDVTAIFAAADNIEEGQTRRARAMMLITASPAGKDLRWTELCKEAQEVEERLLAEVG